MKKLIILCTVILAVILLVPISCAKVPVSIPAPPPTTPETTPNQQSAKLPLRIMSVTSPVRPGVNATLVAQTIPGAECSIIIDYGPSGASRLHRKTADGSGRVSWTWTALNFRGVWQIVVTASYGGETVSHYTFFTIQ